MKKYNLLISLILITSSFVSGQSENSELFIENVDTVFAYNVSYTISTENGKKFYYVNDRESTKAEIEKISNANKQQKECSPCYLVYLNIDEEWVSSGLYYYECKEEKNESIEIEEIQYTSYTYADRSCQEGEWKYYDERGKVKEIKYFHKNEEVKN